MRAASRASSARGKAAAQASSSMLEIMSPPWRSISAWSAASMPSVASRAMRSVNVPRKRRAVGLLLDGSLLVRDATSGGNFGDGVAGGAEFASLGQRARHLLREGLESAARDRHPSRSRGGASRTRSG